MKTELENSRRILLDNSDEFDKEGLSMETNKKIVSKYCDLTQDVYEAFCVLDIAIRFTENVLSESTKHLSDGLYYAFSRYQDAKKKLEEFVDPIIRS